MKRRMPQQPASLKKCNFLVTLEISTLEYNLGEGISAKYVVLKLLIRSELGIRKKNRTYEASAPSERVVAMPARV